MKKVILLLAFLTLSNLNAQTEFGVKAGYNLSQMKWKVSSGFDDYKFDSKSFFYVGGLVEHHLSSKFSVQGELLYTELGGKTSEELYDLVGNEVINIGNNTVTFNTSQIQMPISAKYYVIPQLSFSAGMNFGFNISSKVDQTFTSEMTPSGKIESYKTLNLFPFLGTEFQFNKNLFADFRYHFNFINAAKKEFIPTHFGILQAGIGYRFK